EIWAGTLSLNEEKYNLYIIEGVRPIKASELKDKISEYCKNNPGDQNCKKIKNYCENNPGDSRCKSLFREYCIKSGTKDIRCRQFLMSWCKKNPTNEHCVPFALQRAKHYCELHPDSKICKRIANRVVDFCKAHPENKGCLKVKRIIIERPKLFHGYKIRKSLMNIGSEVTKGNETTVLKSARGPLR
ncbi:MAG: hypothetical protein J7L45_00910, partial [Candidatus Aenigmarchaeota archaeon]|nr:hypothetical protein [Candidatus Aenigmarchaeota archaeon]